MILTKKDLRGYIQYMKISISKELEEELLDKYGHPVEDDEGHIFEYTEQGIHEQILKTLQNESRTHKTPVMF